MNVTIKDVARIAKVSVATVSRVINGSKPVSDEARERVLKVIEETSFKPNIMARGLAKKRSNMIGVIITDIMNVYFSQMVAAIEKTANYYNYSTILCSSHVDETKEIENFHLLTEKGVDGIIFTLHSKVQEKVLNFIERTDIPTVSLDKMCLGTVSIGVDNQKEMYQMTKYLISIGHTHIAYIGGRSDADTTGILRSEGHRKALQESGIFLKQTMFVDGDFKIESGYNACEKLLMFNEQITAIVCACDEMAFGAMNCLIDRGLSVPGDISVAGFDDIALCKYTRPKLTTVHQPITEIGELAAKTIISHSANGKKTAEKHVILKGGLVIRDSTRQL